jgi:hypothetical protein
LFLAVQDVDVRVFRGQFVGEFARAVRRIVVHDEQVHSDREREKSLGHAREVFPLIIRRHDDQRLFHACEPAESYATRGAKTRRDLSGRFLQC